MALFKNNNNNKTKPPVEQNDGWLNESYINQYTNIKGVPLYNFINALKVSSNNEFFFGTTYERMMDDSIISSAVDLYVDDATQIDPSKGKVCWVELDMPDGYIEDKLSKGLIKELNGFLDQINIQDNLPIFCRSVISYGNAPVRLSFIDKAEDELLSVTKLKESADIISDTMGNKLSELKEKYDIGGQTLNENIPVPLEKILNESNRTDRVINKFKPVQVLNEEYTSDKKYLNEDFVGEEKGLNEYNNVMQGRWYVELLGNEKNICMLQAKGKIVALFDKENQNNIITKDNIAVFINPKQTKVVIEVGSMIQSQDEKEYYYMVRGDSFLRNARIAWQILSALEDVLLLTRMTRSILYRIFSVEVANKGNKEAMDILNSLKNKIKQDETIDVKQKIYNSSISQVPLAESIFIPTRNGIGNIKVDTIGGDVNIRDAVDLDYFKDKLFAALKIPKAFLAFEGDMPGGLGNTSLVRMDIRYARTVRGIQNILAGGIKELLNIYLRYTRTPKALNELPNFRVCMTSINTAEDSERIESEKVKMETVDKIVETLGNLGIDLGTYKKTRNKIIQQYFGSELYDIIQEDEKENPIPVIPPTDDSDGDNNDFSSTPSDVSFTGDSNDSDVGGGEPEASDELIGGEDNKGIKLNVDSEEPSKDNSKEPPQNLKYDLK